MLAIRARLASPRVVVFVALVALLLTASSLRSGLALDDFFQKLRAQGKDPFGHHALDLFAFCWGPSDVEIAQRTGMFPWFTQPHTRLVFLRPLASLTHYVDYRVWPSATWLMHAQSIAWYALAVALVALVYRRVIHRQWVAGLAALLYACDDAHAFPAAFLANRNAVMALVFGMGALLLHDRWRAEGSRRAAWLAPLLFAMALLSAEASLGALAYLLAYAVFLESPDTGWRERLRSIAPYLALLVLWQSFARSLGYHIEGSSLYVDPVHEPLRFSLLAPARAIALLLGQLLAPPADTWNLLPRLPQLLLAALALLLLAFMTRVLLPILRRDAPARFFLLGMLLALAPVCATFPSDRLLLFVGIGAMGLIARIIGAFADNEDAQASRSFRLTSKVLTISWLVAHLVLAPLTKPVTSFLPSIAREYIEHSADSVELGADVASQRVIIINAPNFLLASYRWSIPREGARLPASAHVLSLSMDSVEIERIADDTIIVRTGAPFLSELSSKLFRSDRQPLVLGERVRFADIEAEVSEMGQSGLATGVTFRLPSAPDGQGYRYIAWDGDRFVEMELPPVGSRSRVGKDRPRWLMPGDS